MIKTSSLLIFLGDFYYLTYQRVFIEGVLNSRFPWEYGNSFIYQLLKTGLYLIPLLITLGIFLRSIKLEKNIKWTIGLIIISYYFLSIRPTTDYVHLAPLLSFSSIPLVIIFEKLSGKLRFFAFLILCLFTAFSFYSANNRNYYRWYKPLTEQSKFSENPRLGLWIDPNVEKELHMINNPYQNSVSVEKYTFIYSFEPYLYLLLDRHNPTRYDDLHPGFVNENVENEVIRRLEETKPRLITMKASIDNSNSPIYLYIIDNYIEELTLDNWKVYKRNN